MGEDVETPLDYLYSARFSTFSAGIFLKYRVTSDILQTDFVSLSSLLNPEQGDKMENLEEQEKIDEILQKMFDKRGFDVRNYKMSNLQRRISRRMIVLDISSLAEYSEYLDADPDEYEILFNTILVNATRFFRDPEAWSFLREKVLPGILKSGDEIRIWSAGCASGEEPYSVAITLAEMLGDDLLKPRINIHATDIDEAALKFARGGTYTIDQLSGVPEEMREKYFTRRGDVYTIAREIRDLLIFSRNNLVSDPPLSRIDLLLCRNVLIYFDRILQSRIIPKLQYALSDMGYLWLGRAETMVSNIHDLKPMSTKCHIYRKTQSSTYSQIDNVEYTDKYTESDLVSTNDRFKQIIQNIRAGFIMLDRDFNVVMCNRTIQKIWGLLPKQILGKPFLNLDISYRPVDLRNRIEQVVAIGEASAVENAEYWVTKDRRLYLRIEIIPVASDVIIFLEDVTEKYEINKELQVANKALETANEKLLSRNKELESSNKQLQDINEELQSTNEELESMNEEMKATNEELKARIGELKAQKERYQLVLDSIESGIIVTDRDLSVRVWNIAAADMWKSGSNEIMGTFLMNLDIDLPLELLAHQLREVMNTGKPAVDRLEGTDRWGRKAIVDISINPRIERPGEPEGLVLIFRKVTDEALTAKQSGSEFREW